MQEMAQQEPTEIKTIEINSNDVVTVNISALIGVIGFFTWFTPLGFGVGLIIMIISSILSSTVAKECPYCNSSVSPLQQTKPICNNCKKEIIFLKIDNEKNKFYFQQLVSIILLIAVVSYVGIGIYNNEKLKKAEETKQEAIQPISPEESLKQEILNVNPNIDGLQLLKNKAGKYNVKMRYSHDPLGIGSVDWNNISILTFDVSKIVFNNSLTNNLEITTYSPDNNSVDYAIVKVNRNDIPETFADLLYHEFFTYVKPIALNQQSEDWLCKYYDSYTSARPYGQMPELCSDYKRSK